MTSQNEKMVGFVLVIRFREQKLKNKTKQKLKLGNVMEFGV